MASVRKLTLPSGNTLYSPGGKVAIDVGLCDERDFNSREITISAKLEETATHLILTLGYMSDVIKPEGVISWEFQELSTSTLDKSTGEVVESDPEKILSFFSDYSRIDTDTGICVLNFAVNVAYINNRYAYEAIKNSEILKYNNLGYSRIRTRTIFLYWMMVHELDFLEKLLKTSKDILYFNIDDMDVREFLSKYKDNAIPSGVLAKINSMSEKNYTIRGDTKNTLIRVVQHITQNEDGNNAKLFIDWLDAWIDLGTSADPYHSKPHIDGFLDKMLDMLIKRGYSSKPLLDYLTRQTFYYGNFSLPTEELTQLCDYLKIGDEVSVTTEQFPSQVRKAHNCIIANRNAFTKISPEKAKAFSEACAESAAKYATKMGDYVVAFPKEPKDLFIEGTVLNHCVGGYVNPVLQRETIVGFLRKKSEPDTPLYTIEIKNGVVIQAKGAYNADVPPDIATLLKQVEKRWSLRGAKALKEGEEEDA